MRFEAHWQAETCREMYVFFCLKSTSLSVNDFSLQHSPTITISLWFQSPSYTWRKYGGEQVKFGVIWNHVAAWKAIIRKTKPEKSHWYQHTWNLSAKGQCGLFLSFSGPFEKHWGWDLLSRLSCAYIKSGRAAYRKVLPPKSFVFLMLNFPSGLWISCFSSLLLGNWAVLNESSTIFGVMFTVRLLTRQHIKPAVTYRVKQAVGC